MNKLGDMPVSLVLTRDQVRMLRFAMKLADTTPPLWWDYSVSRKLSETLDSCSCDKLASDHLYCAVHGHI